jgi:ectoine hydroxylase-related dioxygenase (phytanoyl-CoA dioxygenase family)
MINNSLKSNYLNEYTLDDLTSNLDQAISSYDQHGIILLKNYINTNHVTTVLDEIDIIQTDAKKDIAQNWNNKVVCFYSKNPSASSNTTRDYVTESYFQKSSQKAHVFYETINHIRVVNRIGHGMHLIDKYTNIQNVVYHNPMLLTLLKGLAYQKPVCHLSVYIPKHPRGIGSEVRPHQESSFAYTEPTSVTVLWLALEDACIDNACMYGIPGSHRWPLKWISQVNHHQKTREFLLLNNIHIPDFITEKSQYIPLEVKAGDALLFHGNFVHCSPANHSTRSRRALSFQFLETAGVHYPDFNWLQPANRVYLY